MSKWVRMQEEMPSFIRVNFGINTSKHPKLAEFLHGLPYGTQSETIRKILEEHLGIANDAPALQTQNNVAQEKTIPIRQKSAEAPRHIQSAQSMTAGHVPVNGINVQSMAKKEIVSHAINSSANEIPPMDAETSSWITDLDRELG